MINSASLEDPAGPSTNTAMRDTISITRQHIRKHMLEALQDARQAIVTSHVIGSPGGWVHLQPKTW